MLVLGIDIGGTDVKYAAVDKNGNVSNFSKFGFKKDADKLISLIYEKTKRFNFSKIGVAIAGDVDSTKGIVRFSPNLNWKNLNIKKKLSDVFGKPSNIENDANAAAYGSYVLDFKKKYGNIVCITIGTGVGGGLIIDGKLYRGSTGSAGELGHQTYMPQGRNCPCGNLGCFERYLGAPGIIKTAEEKIKKIKTKTNMLSTDKNFNTPEMITMAAKNGDKLAIEIWDDVGKILGTLLSNAINSLNPDAIVLAGGISKAGDFLLKPAVKEMKERAFKYPSSRTKIIISGHQEHLGVAGAAMLSMNK